MIRDEGGICRKTSLIRRQRRDREDALGRPGLQQPAACPVSPRRLHRERQARGCTRNEARKPGREESERKAGVSFATQPVTSRWPRSMHFAEWRAT